MRIFPSMIPRPPPHLPLVSPTGSPTPWLSPLVKPNDDISTRDLRGLIVVSARETGIQKYFKINKITHFGFKNQVWSCECLLSYMWICVYDMQSFGPRRVFPAQVLPMRRHVCFNSHCYRFIMYFSILFYMYVINNIKCLVSVSWVDEMRSSCCFWQFEELCFSLIKSQ